MGMAKFLLPPHNPQSSTDHQKLITGDCVDDPEEIAKFGANPSTGILGKWLKYNEDYFYRATVLSIPAIS